jgi:hypothetical protein
MFFDKKGKNRKTQEQLNEEFSKLGEEEVMENDTEVAETYEESSKMAKITQKPIPKPVTRPNISQNETVSNEEADILPKDIRKFATEFDNDYSNIKMVDNNFTLQFAIYSELKRQNRILAGHSVLLEDLIQIIKEN